ncbi:hypothetical protein SUDANB15_02551 [Streptomyces sp. enrichment culture]|uniref:hypothetical protein n=1 Tax=Streptomyces sp. enrichment culture TaxID=1795815 RepID=UPI003F5697DA
MRITADRLNDHAIEAQTSSGVTPPADFTTNNFLGYKVGGMTTVSLVMTYSGSTITSSTAGNIGDKVCATLPAGWRPPFTVVTSYDRSGVADGSVSIAPDGTCTLKTLSPNATIGDGNNVSFMATWVSGNA